MHAVVRMHGVRIPVQTGIRTVTPMTFFRAAGLYDTKTVSSKASEICLMGFRQTVFT